MRRPYLFVAAASAACASAVFGPAADVRAEKPRAAQAVATLLDTIFAGPSHTHGLGCGCAAPIAPPEPTCEAAPLYVEPTCGVEPGCGAEPGGAAEAFLRQDAFAPVARPLHGPVRMRLHSHSPAGVDRSFAPAPRLPQEPSRHDGGSASSPMTSETEPMTTERLPVSEMPPEPVVEPAPALIPEPVESEPIEPAPMPKAPTAKPKAPKAEPQAPMAMPPAPKPMPRPKRMKRPEAPAPVDGAPEEMPDRVQPAPMPRPVPAPEPEATPAPMPLPEAEVAPMPEPAEAPMPEPTPRPMPPAAAMPKPMPPAPSPEPEETPIPTPSVETLPETSAKEPAPPKKAIEPEPLPNFDDTDPFADPAPAPAPRPKAGGSSAPIDPATIEIPRFGDGDFSPVGTGVQPTSGVTSSTWSVRPAIRFVPLESPTIARSK